MMAWTHGCGPFTWSDVDLGIYGASTAGQYNSAMWKVWQAAAEHMGHTQPLGEIPGVRVYATET